MKPLALLSAAAVVAGLGVTFVGAAPATAATPICGAVPPGVTASSSVESRGWSTSKIVDGLTGVDDPYGWRSGDESQEDVNEWVQLDLHASYDITEIALWPIRPSLQWSGSRWFPINYQVLVSNDPTFATYTTFASRTVLDSPAAAQPVIEVGAASGRYVRVDASKLRFNSAVAFGLAEIVVSGNLTTPAGIVQGVHGFDHDTFQDLMVKTTSGKLYLVPGTGDGQRKPSQLIGTGWKSLKVLWAGDKSGDGYTDLLAVDSNGGLRLYRGDGNGKLLPGFRKVGTGWKDLTVFSPGDFDRDCLPDLITRDRLGRGWLYPGAPNDRFRTKVALGTGWSSYTALLSPGDFNLDGFPDMIARDKAGNLWLFPGNGKALGAKVQIATGFKAAKAVFSPGDFTGDEKPDVLIADTRGAVWLYAGDGSSALGTPVLVLSGWSKHAIIR